MWGCLDESGNIVVFEYSFSSGDVVFNLVIFLVVVRLVIGVDIGVIWGGMIMYCNIFNIKVIFWYVDFFFVISWWCSLGLLVNIFVIESFVDELVIKVERNVVDFRFVYFFDIEVGICMVNVIKVCIEKVGYSEVVINGRVMGFVVFVDVGLFCVYVVEVSVENNEIKVYKVIVGFDCGIVVNFD